MKSKHLTTWIWEQPDWPKFTWNSAALAAPLAAARRVQGEVAGMAKLLDLRSDLNAQLEVLTAEGVATSAIEEMPCGTHWHADWDFQRWAFPRRPDPSRGWSMSCWTQPVAMTNH